MQVGRSHLGYCTNVHPGETPSDLAAVIDDHLPSIARILTHDGPLGAGLRLGNRLTSLLTRDHAAFAHLYDRCEQENVYVFTVNGFPYGDFQATSIKAAVYHPDWRARERVRYTLELARLVARLPGPPRRTISTVAGGYAPETGAHDIRRHMAQNLLETAEGLALLAQETGVSIRLCLEPEPWTTMETTAQTIDFFLEHLDPQDDLVREHLGVCYDCCHQAVQFEDARTSLRALRAAGIVVGKIQVSSALHLDTPSDPEGRAHLMAFAEPRYLHQVVGLTDDGILRCKDLPELARPDPDWCGAKAWRCHFHVPIQWQGNAHLGTTRNDWEHAIEAALELGDPYPHFEVETYTWSVLPPPMRPRGREALHQAIAQEFRAVLPVLEAG